MYRQPPRRIVQHIPQLAGIGEVGDGDDTAGMQVFRPARSWRTRQMIEIDADMPQIPLGQQGMLIQIRLIHHARPDMHLASLQPLPDTGRRQQADFQRIAGLGKQLLDQVHSPAIYLTGSSPLGIADKVHEGHPHQRLVRRYRQPRQQKQQPQPEYLASHIDSLQPLPFQPSSKYKKPLGG